MLRMSNGGQACSEYAHGFNWNPPGEWTEAPDWNEKRDVVLDKPVKRGLRWKVIMKVKILLASFSNATPISIILRHGRITSLH